MSTNMTIIGNLTADPHVNDKNPEAPCVTFAVASNRKYTTKGGEQVTETTFMDCVAWRDLGLHVAASLSKGDRVFVQGYVEQSNYEATDAAGNTVKRSRLRLIVNTVGPDLRFATCDVTRIPAATPAAVPTTATAAA